MKTCYDGLRLVCPDTMKLRTSKSVKMIGVVRTVQLSIPNDFLPVLSALNDTRPGDVLVVNTGGSDLAVAGSLFTTEASRRGAKGLVVDGPIRDSGELACPTYSTRVTPYAGTAQHPGEGIDSSPIRVGGVTVHPGDIIFGDADGILVGSIKSFAACLEGAENILHVESKLLEGMRHNLHLHKMTNFDRHIELRKQGKESDLKFN